MSEVAGPGLVDLLRLVAALGAVLALALLAGKLARRGLTLRRAGRSGPRARVDERLTLGRGAHLVLVEIGGRRLLVGVTDHSVQLVSDLGAGAADEVPAASAADDEAPAAARPQRFAEWLGAALKGLR